MNKILGMLRKILMLAILCSTSALHAADLNVLESQTYTIELSDSDQSAILRLESEVDQITVVAEQRTNLLFEITARTDFDEKIQRQRFYTNNDEDDEFMSRDNSGLTKIDANIGLDFVLEEADNLVRFETENINYDDSFHIMIRVPVNTSLMLETSDSGSITISGANGNHELSNRNGAIYATNISGSIIAETRNGEIVITMLTITEDSPMAFSTVNGSVDLTFPPSYGADARIDAGRGDTYSDFTFDVQRTDPDIERSDDGRGSRIDTRGLSGLINGGGATLRVETVTGDVYIRQGNN